MSKTAAKSKNESDKELQPMIVAESVMIQCSKIVLWIRGNLVKYSSMRWSIFFQQRGNTCEHQKLRNMIQELLLNEPIALNENLLPILYRKRFAIEED
jgi:hypothetical protein